MNEELRPSSQDAEDEERPPVGRTWTLLYVVVLANLALLVCLFYLFKRAFE